MTMAGDTRVAVVSGGNRGIGREIARGLVERDFDVVATSRTEAGRADVEAVGARWLPLDVSRRDSVGAFGEAVGDVDVLVNNAGVALDGFDAEVVLQTMAVNFLGAMHLTDTLLPKLRSGGRVVNVSSGMGELSCLGPRLRARFADPDLTREDLVTLVESFERDVESDRAAAARWRQLNRAGTVPVADVDGRVLVGFVRDEWREALDAAAHRRAGRASVR